MRPFLHILGLLLWLYLLCLMVRMALGWVQVFARNWRPRGAMLVVAEAVYTITDPPLRLIRRYIPPLRLGGIGLDIGFMLLFFLVLTASQMLSAA